MLPDDKTPPHDLEAEAATLGAMMLSPKAAVRGLAILRREDFWLGAHQEIFSAIETCQTSNRGVELITVSAELRRQGKLKDISAEYLVALLAKPFTAEHIKRYAGIVAEASILRQLAALGEKLTGAAYDQAAANETIAMIADRLFAVRARTTGTGMAMPLSVEYDDYWEWQNWIMQQPKEVRGARLGLPSLDRIVGGFANWEFVVFKAREKYGKTRLLRQSILETASAGIPVLVYVLEGNKTRWLQHAVAYLARVPAKLLDAGGAAQQTPQQAEAIAQAMSDLASLPIIMSTTLTTVQEIQADVLAHWYSDDPKPEAVYIDYLQLMVDPGARGRTEEIKAALAMILATNSLTGMPFITASQISGEDHKTFYSSEAQHAASLVWEIERGPADEDLPAAQARMHDSIRLINTHKRYGPMILPWELRADWASGRFSELESKYENGTSDAIRF